MQEKIKHFTEKKHVILPIITLDDSAHQVNDIVPVISALQKGGLNAVEITLRSHLAIDAINIARKEFPNLQICAGSITNTEQINQLKNFHLDFLISPGITENLLLKCTENQIDILPGVMTPSDILLGIQHKLKYFKYFPAAVNGGTEILKSISAPFPDCHFCATGGITIDNALDFLRMKNVFCVATSSIVTTEDISKKNWNAICEKAEAFNSLNQR